MKRLTDITGRLGNQLFQFSYIYAQMLDGKVPDVYLQSPEYFDHHREELRELYGIPDKTVDFVAMHVRRTDYLDNPFYVNLCDTDYYERAMAEFPGERFLVFSDDPMWCVENFKGKEYHFSYGTESEDFETMASCKGIIMANSSFSWWASYLSNCGKVIAPKEWFSDKIERTKCLPEWIQL